MRLTSLFRYANYNYNKVITTVNNDLTLYIMHEYEQEVNMKYISVSEPLLNTQVWNALISSAGRVQYIWR